MKKLLCVFGIVIIAAAAYLLFWPVPFEPVAWDAPKAPGLSGEYAANSKLADVEWLAKGVAAGPEDVDVDSEGRIYGAFEDGKIRRFASDGSQPEIFADTKGRPLGLAWASDGSLVIADAVKGLLAARSDGSLRKLADSVNDQPFGFADDVDVAADGTIYLTDASSKFGYETVMADILEHGGNGRLIKYEPLADEASVLLDGLQFANGIAVGPDERYVLVNETGAYRITRYWLKGPKKGQSEVFIDNLPGLPDGVSFNGKNIFWVAIYAPRNPELDYMADKPWLRKIAYRLPEALQPKPVKHAFVLGINTDGKVVHNLQDKADQAYAPITSAQQVGDTLYFGSLSQPAIARMPAPQ